MAKDDEMVFSWEEAPHEENGLSGRGESVSGQNVPAAQGDRGLFSEKQTEVPSLNGEALEQGQAKTSTVRSSVVSSSESDNVLQGKEGRPSPEISKQDNAGQDTRASGGTTSGLDAVDVFRHAMDFLEATFGKKWVERASLQALRFKDLTAKVRLLQKRFVDAQEKIRLNEHLIAENRVTFKDNEAKRAALEKEKEQLNVRLSEIAHEKLQMEQRIRESEYSGINDVTAKLQEAFGVASPLYGFICELPPPVMVKIGYAVVFSLPAANPQVQGGPGPNVPIHALVVMASKFLQNVTDYDGPERGRLLNLAAEHLSRVSQMFSFHNEEGQLFDSDRHAVLSGFTPSSGAKVTRTASFFVFNTRTKQPFQKAEVTL